MHANGLGIIRAIRAIRGLSYSSRSRIREVREGIRDVVWFVVNSLSVSKALRKVSYNIPGE
jgi:hypothetical protein